MKKILLLGHGVSNDGVKEFFDSLNISYDYLELKDVKDKYDYVIKSPGIPISEEVINLGKSLKSDVEIISEFVNSDFIAVTGTNGKTTVTMLIEEILAKKYNCKACGNIGYPIGKAVLEKRDFYIAELSSFQLECTNNFKPKVAILLNIEPHHLDHHKTFKEYIKSKEKITLNQDENDYLIYNADSVFCKEIASRSKAKKISFSTNSLLSNCFIIQDKIYYNDKKVMDLKKVDKLHMQDIENYMAVCCLLSIYKIPFKLSNKIFRNFKKAPFRAQVIKKNIINDAKSTNPYSTIASLNSLTNVLLICGGYDRGERLYVLCPYLSKITKVYAYGESKHKIKDFCDELNVSCNIFNTLTEATYNCLNEKKENTILYSPMFASYDQYNNYIERGKEFNKIIFDYENNHC